MYTAYHTNGCPHCGMGHTGTCPRVKAIEYYQDGSIKRVEFREWLSVNTPSGGVTTTPVVISPIGPIGNDLRKPTAT